MKPEVFEFEVLHIAEWGWVAPTKTKKIAKDHGESGRN